MSKYWYSVVHAIAECEDCDWKTSSYKNAQAIAKIHAKKHGHIDYNYPELYLTVCRRCNIWMDKGKEMKMRET